MNEKDIVYSACEVAYAQSALSAIDNMIADYEDYDGALTAIDNETLIKMAEWFENFIDVRTKQLYDEKVI